MKEHIQIIFIMYFMGNCTYCSKPQIQLKLEFTSKN